MLATGISTLVQILYAALMIAVSYFFLGQLVDQVQIPDLNLPGANPAGFFNASILITGIGLCLAPLAYAGTGLLYAYLARREDGDPSETAIIGGAASAGLSRILSGIFSVTLSTVGTTFWMGSNPLFGPSPGALRPNTILITLLTSMIFGLVNIFFAAMFAAFIGALGAAISSLFFNR